MLVPAAAVPAAARVLYEETAHVDVDVLLDEWGAYLDGQERARLGNLRFERDRRDYLAAHALLRLGLRETRDRNPARPAPADRSGWSLTHCAGFVACAFSGDPDDGIGVDAEPAAAALRLASMSAVFVTPRERAWLKETRASDARLVDLWTAKEAALKALGRGLTGPRGFDVLLTLECTPGGGVEGWQGLRVEDTHSGEHLPAWLSRMGDFVLAVAVRGTENAPPPRAVRWPRLSRPLVA